MELYRKDEQAQTRQGGAWAWALLLEIRDLGTSMSTPLAQALGQELVSMGVDPNAGPALSDALAKGFRWDSDWLEPQNPIETARVQWALKFGFEFAQHPDLLAKTCTLNSRYAMTRVSLFASLGVHAAQLSPTDASPLAASMRHGMWKTLSWLCKKAPLNYVNPQGESALHALVALESPNHEEQLGVFLAHTGVRLLLEQGSTRPGAEGETALHRACAALNLKAVEQLLRAGANPNAQDARGWTPLRHALRKFNDKARHRALPVVRELLAYAADPSVPDAQDYTPMQAAAARAPLAALSELLSLRPNDLTDQSEGAREAQKRLRARGGDGTALAEHAILGRELGMSPKSNGRHPPSSIELPSTGGATGLCEVAGSPGAPVPADSNPPPKTRRRRL